MYFAILAIVFHLLFKFWFPTLSITALMKDLNSEVVHYLRISEDISALQNPGDNN